jgi:catalase-peroxidase
MAMNDEEIVALIAGGHTLGKAHGAKSGDCVGPEPAAADIEEQGFGWTNKCGSGKGADTMTSGLEGAWTSTPTAWSILFLDNLFRFEWQQTKTPAGATVWIPTEEHATSLVPDAHVEGKRNPPIMLTTDLSLREDPGFRAISERFLKNPKEFDEAFARAWFKLTHRDLGPRSRYLGSEIPDDVFVWQDPVPAVDHDLIGDKDVDKLKADILKSGLSGPELMRTAWASASTYRKSDMRGGANGARIRLAPQKDWDVNDPDELAKVLNTLGEIQQAFNDSQGGDKRVSFSDLIVLGGVAAVEQAARDSGHKVEVPFTPGRTDASQEMTDVKSFAVLEPTADAFRNYYSLTVPEMTALVGGMRVANANTGQSAHGVFTDTPGTLSNDFFVNLLDMSTTWSKSADHEGIYEGRDRSTGELKWTATPVDLVFGSNSELRAVAEAYAATDGEEKFISDFVAAWTKVMSLDRFDLD